MRESNLSVLAYFLHRARELEEVSCCNL